MRMRLMTAIAAIAGLAATPAAAEYRLSADDWAHPRSGERITRLEPVQAVVRDWMHRPGQRIVIRYAGGEAGGLWAAELRDWLVGLGIPSDRLRLEPGGPRPEWIELEVGE